MEKSRQELLNATMLDNAIPKCCGAISVEWMKSIGGRFRHYKGNEYEVVGIAAHSETLEPMVVYRQLYGEHALWVRPAAMFFEDVEIDGNRVRRFAPVEGK